MGDLIEELCNCWRWVCTNRFENQHSQGIELVHNNSGRYIPQAEGFGVRYEEERGSRKKERNKERRERKKGKKERKEKKKKKKKKQKAESRKQKAESRKQESKRKKRKKERKKEKKDFERFHHSNHMECSPREDSPKKWGECWVVGC